MANWKVEQNEDGSVDLTLIQSHEVETNDGIVFENSAFARMTFRKDDPTAKRIMAQVEALEEFLNNDTFQKVIGIRASRKSSAVALGPQTKPDVRIC